LPASADNAACRCSNRVARQAFATEYAEALSGGQLRLMMRHSSYTTTQKYIDMARQMNGLAAKLKTPVLSRQAN
jgi:hypothetical protein